jgi:hypothetical protein
MHNLCCKFTSLLKNKTVVKTLIRYLNFHAPMHFANENICCAAVLRITYAFNKKITKETDLVLDPIVNTCLRIPLAI